MCILEAPIAVLMWRHITGPCYLLSLPLIPLFQIPSLFLPSSLPSRPHNSPLPPCYFLSYPSPPAVRTTPSDFAPSLRVVSSPFRALTFPPPSKTAGDSATSLLNMSTNHCYCIRPPRQQSTAFRMRMPPLDNFQLHRHTGIGVTFSSCSEKGGYIE